MKKILHGIIPVMVVFLLSSCSKDNNELKPTANIYVVNAVVGGSAVKVNPGATSGFFYKNAADLGYGSSGVYGTYTGSNNVKVVSSADTTKTLFNGTLNLQSINSLYLAGQSPNIDTIFRAETNFPFIQSAKLNPDSSIYIRFVNLSPNSTPLKVTITSATTNEVDALPYKGISGFKKYSARPGASSNYAFEIRDIATNTRRTTVNINTNSNRYKTILIIIKDLMNAVPGPGVADITTFQLNYN